jgi:CRP-like cAMP-binding protein
MLATAFATEEYIGTPVSLANVLGKKSTTRLLSSRIEGAVRIIEAKDHAFREGDPVTSVYQVEAGHTCLYRLLPDGRRQVIDFAYPGDYVGLGAVGHHTVSAQASERTRLQAFPVSAFRDLARTNPDLSLSLYEAVSQELLAARELLMTVCQRTALERVAAFLLALSRRNERRGEAALELVLPMTRTDIADFLGLTIETVSRTFTKLRQDGVIDLEQCIIVTICDVDRLVALSGGGFDNHCA